MLCWSLGLAASSLKQRGVDRAIQILQVHASSTRDGSMGDRLRSAGQRGNCPSSHRAHKADVGLLFGHPGLCAKR